MLCEKTEVSDVGKGNTEERQRNGNRANQSEQNKSM